MRQIIFLLFLIVACPTFASDARTSERECIQGMTSAVDAAGPILSDAQTRTGKVNVDDDMQMIHEMGELPAVAKDKCDSAKKTSSDLDQQLIDNALSKLNTYLLLYGLPGDSSLRAAWIDAVKKLESDGGNDR